TLSRPRARLTNMANLRAHLLWALVATCPVASVAAEAKPTGTAEVDLVFPRNDTYAPMPLMPVVFAVQNPPVAGKLYPEILYKVHPVGDLNATDYKSVKMNLPGNDTTYFTYDGVANLVNSP
ncbi:hypothetical protein QU781_28035, partial [Escherichia coli]|nr:hypothetical protein [Escherichia coli]